MNGFHDNGGVIGFHRRWVLGAVSERDTAVLAAADEALDVDDWASDSWWTR